MTNQSLNLMRIVLLILIAVNFGLTAFLYFRTGKINFAGVTVALGCLVIFLVTGRKAAS